LGKGTVAMLAKFTLNAQTMTTLSSPSADHVSAIWCPHSGTKSRGSFSLTASAAQGSLHTFLLLDDFYKKSQSAILPLYRQYKHISGWSYHVTGDRESIRHTAEFRSQEEAVRWTGSPA